MTNDDHIIAAILAAGVLAGRTSGTPNNETVVNTWDGIRKAIQNYKPEPVPLNVKTGINRPPIEDPNPPRR